MFIYLSKKIAIPNGVRLKSRGERGAAFRHVDLFKESAGWAPG